MAVIVHHCRIWGVLILGLWKLWKSRTNKDISWEDTLDANSHIKDAKNIKVGDQVFIPN